VHQLYYSFKKLILVAEGNNWNKSTASGDVSNSLVSIMKRTIDSTNFVERNNCFFIFFTNISLRCG